MTILCHRTRAESDCCSPSKKTVGVLSSSRVRSETNKFRLSCTSSLFSKAEGDIDESDKWEDNLDLVVITQFMIPVVGVDGGHFYCSGLWIMCDEENVLDQTMIDFFICVVYTRPEGTVGISVFCVYNTYEAIGAAED